MLLRLVRSVLGEAGIQNELSNIVDIKTDELYNISGKEALWMKNLRMKAARVGCDLSQEELAARVGVTRQTIGMIEAGRFNPSLALCVVICRALDKTLNDLFWEEEGEA